VSQPGQITGEFQQPGGGFRDVQQASQLGVAALIRRIQSQNPNATLQQISDQAISMGAPQDAVLSSVQAINKFDTEQSQRALRPPVVPQTEAPAGSSGLPAPGQNLDDDLKRANIKALLSSIDDPITKVGKTEANKELAKEAAIPQTSAIEQLHDIGKKDYLSGAGGSSRPEKTMEAIQKVRQMMEDPTKRIGIIAWARDSEVGQQMIADIKGAITAERDIRGKRGKEAHVIALNSFLKLLTDPKFVLDNTAFDAAIKKRDANATSVVPITTVSPRPFN
jgi:hypothetical protein